MPRKRPSRVSTFLNVHVTNKKEDGHFVTPYNCNDKFVFTLPDSISEETWLETLRDISSKISPDNNSYKSNNIKDYIEIVSSSIQNKFPQLDKRIPLFVARTLTLGPPSDWKKNGQAEGNIDFGLEKGLVEGVFGSIGSNEGNEINDGITLEDIIFRELISDLGELPQENFDLEEGQSKRQNFDQGDNLDWISDLDDDELVDPSERESKSAEKIRGKTAKKKDRKTLNYFFSSDVKEKTEEFGGLSMSSHTVLLAGSTSGIDWKVKRYETNDRHMDVLLKPDHESNIDEMIVVTQMVVTAVFENKYTDEVDPDRIKISLVPQGFESSSVWIGSPRSFDLADFVANLSKKIESHKGISFHFGITIRFSRSDENGKSMKEKVMKFVETKKSIIKVKNDDFRGLARSIITAMSHPANENHPSWGSLRKGGRILERLTRNLHMMSGVTVKKHYNCTDFEAFQKAIPAKYSLIVLGDPWTQKILYAGPHAPSNIYVFNFEDLYFAVIKAAGFYSSSYFCGKCLKRYETPDHVCKEKDLNR